MSKLLSSFVALLLIISALAVTLAPSTASANYVPAKNFNLTPANSHPTGITWNGSYFFVTDNQDNKIYRYNSAGVLAGHFSLQSNNTDAEGVTWDGTHLRVVDNDDRTVYKYTQAGTYVSNFTLNSNHTWPVGITWDETYLRIAERSNDDVFAYTSAGAYINTQDFSIPSNKPSGITWDGTYYRAVAFQPSPGKVFAYTSTRTREANRDLTLASDNDYPSGITYVNNHLYVVDYTDNKVYAYKPPTSVDVTPPNPTITTSANLYYPGPPVTLQISSWDSTTFQDHYAVLVNPTDYSDFITSAVGNNSYGMLQAGETTAPDRCNDTAAARLSRTIALSPSGTNIPIEACVITDEIAESINISTGQIASINFKLVNASNGNSVVSTFSIPLHTNDILLTIPLETIYPSTATHGPGTTGLAWPARWKHGGSQTAGIKWVANGPGTTATISFTDPGASCPTTPNPNTQYVTTDFNSTDPGRTIWICRSGLYQLAAYYWDSSATEADNIVSSTRIRKYVQKATDYHLSSLNIGTGQGETSLPVDEAEPAVPFTPTPIGTTKNFRTFTDEIPNILHVTVEDRNQDGTFNIVAAYTSVTGATRYEIRIDQPTANNLSRSVQTLPTMNAESLEHNFTTLSSKGQLNIRLRAAADCPPSAFKACEIDRLTNSEKYMLAPGATAYSRWSQKYYAAISLLEVPKEHQGQTFDPNGRGRHPTIDLSTEFGDLAVAITGVDHDQSRNLGITIFGLICLGLATAIYVKAWRASGSESALSPIGGALATLSLFFTWTILGYTFFQLKEGTALLPLIGILFVVIVKGWNTVKQ